MRKVLSVSIAAYNVDKYLNDVLSCFLAEEVLKKSEIIIVSDGSTDQTPVIARKYVEKYPDTFILIDKQNGGWGSTLNAAMKIATGKYFKVIDSDDWVEAESYHKFLELLKTLDCDLIATRFVCVHAQQNKIKKREIEGSKQIPKETILSFCDYARKLHIRMHECTMRTKLLIIIENRFGFQLRRLIIVSKHERSKRSDQTKLIEKAQLIRL